jgi:hypothetical protein
MKNFKMILLNLLYGAIIVFAIVALQKSGGALVLNVPSKILEERCKKSLSNSLKTTLFPSLFGSMEEKEFLIILFDLAILSKNIFGIQCGPWYIKPRSLHSWEFY